MPLISFNNLSDKLFFDLHYHIKNQQYVFNKLHKIVYLYFYSKTNKITICLDMEIHDNDTIKHVLPLSQLSLIMKQLSAVYKLDIAVNRLKNLHQIDASNIYYKCYTMIISGYLALHSLLPMVILQYLINIQHILGMAFQYYLVFIMTTYKYNMTITSLPDIQMPIYTILLPMYKEFNKLKSIVHSISNLQYPRERLDVKIIIEDDDILMKRELAITTLAPYFEVIVIPDYLPKTKPKALNYAMLHAKGEMVTVYDAEDRPHAQQLITALQHFYQMPDEYICMQSKLCFYNSDENLLTQCMSIEYMLWFEVIQKSLESSNLPVFLGGTSNHFKTKELISLGLWDAYNVTEDAELSIRIYDNGYKTHIIDSYTDEEAPIYISDWIKQRTRWIKGFLQTWYLFFMRTKKHINQLQSCSTHLMLFCGTMNFISLPILLIVNWMHYSSYNIEYILYCTLCLQNIIRYIAITNFSTPKPFYVKILLLCVFQVYFLLHSVASYFALYELMCKPFHWNKTRHGLSTLFKKTL